MDICTLVLSDHAKRVLVLSRLEDPSGSLISERNKWLRRQTLISSIVEQLKSKDCKTVLATLVANKSRLIKKWRTIDMQ